MKVPKIALITCWSILLVLPNLLQAQTTMSNPDALKSVRKFVQDFYSWYVPKVLKFDDDSPASGRALKERGYVFSPELFKALKEDSDAQARARELVGLDFDAFLDTQDPAARYRLGRIAQKGNTYLVEVFGVYDVRPSDRPDGMPEVIAEVARRNGQWVFTNFLYPPVAKHYPDSANLLAILKGLKEDRRRSEQKHRAE
jgi:hypothetical protein